MIVVTVLPGQSYPDVAAQYLGDTSQAYLIFQDDQPVDLNQRPESGQVLILPGPAPDKIPLVNHLKTVEPITTASINGIGFRIVGITFRIG